MKEEAGRLAQKANSSQRESLLFSLSKNPTIAILFKCLLTAQNLYQKTLSPMLETVSFPSKSSLSFRSHRHHMFVFAAVAPFSAAVVNKNLYEVLKVKQNATKLEIKTAYRTLAKLYHPDAASLLNSSVSSSLSDGRDFIEIHNAYSTLLDPNSRAVYDLKLNVGSQWQSPGKLRFYPTRRWETDQCW